jgi:ribosomal protein S19
MRSKKKPVFTDYLKTIYFQNFENIRGFSRRSTITKEFVGVRLLIYSGKKLKSFLVKPEAVGKKFGSFVLTKRLGKIHSGNVRIKKKK